MNIKLLILLSINNRLFIMKWSTKCIISHILFFQYLDTQHINHLTTYLQALHKAGAATADHTSLMLNCYTRLRDTEQLDEFITVSINIQV